MTSPNLDLRGLLVDLAQTDIRFVVIGSSALRLQGWDVGPSDLDIFVPEPEADAVRALLDAPETASAWVEEGAARRLEVELPRGSVDIYVKVSGGFDFDGVRESGSRIQLGVDDLAVCVGSLEHVRDMRVAVGRREVPDRAVAPAARDGAPHVIAIDGPAGAGKSTVTKAVANALGFTYLNTGAMYRAVTLEVLRRKADPDDAAEIGRIAHEVDFEFKEDRILVGGEDVTTAIRTPEVTEATPHIAAYPEVREAMIDRQRDFFRQGSYVAEGRDTSTVVAPDAPLKIYLTASPEERARRRALETGRPVEDELAALAERDRLDKGRAFSALRQAEDAVVVDTTGRTIEDVVGEIGELARGRGIG